MLFSAPLFTCDFETGNICGMEQYEDNDYWILNSENGNYLSSGYEKSKGYISMEVRNSDYYSEDDHIAE